MVLSYGGYGYGSMVTVVMVSSSNTVLLSLDTWSGPYNNKCTKWTEELRSELMVYPDSSEAVFWMELSDFVRYTYMIL